MRKWLVLGMVGLVLLAGCGKSEGNKSEGNKTAGFSPADMCIQKVDDAKIKVCYGDTREDVEKIWGEGSPGALKFFTDYAPGVIISYRDDVVAMLQLDAESVGQYQIAAGFDSDVSLKEIEKAYGTEHSVKGERDIAYYYSLKEQKLLPAPSHSMAKEELEQIMAFSAVVTPDSQISRMMMMDMRMGAFME